MNKQVKYIAHKVVVSAKEENTDENGTEDYQAREGMGKWVCVILNKLVWEDVTDKWIVEVIYEEG